MEYDQLLDLYNQLAALADASDEKGAQELLAKHFSELPEELQGELVTRMYLYAIEKQGREANALMDVQEQALDAMAALEVLKKELEKGTGGAPPNA